MSATLEEINNAIEAFLTSNDLPAFEAWIEQLRSRPLRRAPIYVVVDDLQKRAFAAGRGPTALGLWQALAVCAELLQTGAGAKPAHVIGEILMDDKQHRAAIRWLQQSIEGFEQFGTDRDIEVASLCMLSACEIRSNDRRRALATAERAVAVASVLDEPGTLARALMQRAKAKQNLNVAPLDDARRSLGFRRKASTDAYVEPMPTYLWYFGRMARELGAYDEAHEAFAEMEALAAEDPFDAALAMSERGFTYVQVREHKRASEYFRRAVHQAPPELAAAARRWSLLVSIYDGTATVAGMPDPSTLPLDDDESALTLLAVLGTLQEERASAVIPAARRLIDWARDANAYEILIAAHNTLAIALVCTGDLAGAMKELHRAIYHSDGRRLLSQGIDLRIHLVQVFTRRRMLQEAFDVYDFALAYIDEARSVADSTEIRQQIVAHARPLFEWMARTTVDHHLFARFLRDTEAARGQNLLDVAALSDRLDEEKDPARRELLKELRAADVELEVSTIAGDLDSNALRELRTKRQQVRGRLEVDRDVARVDAAKLTSAAVEQGNVVVSLFDTKQGVAAVVARPDGTFNGEFLAWERAERRLPSSRYSRLGRGARNFERLETEDLDAALHEHLFAPLAKMIGVVDADILLIPHGQLAVVPYWRLIDLVAPTRTLCISPSLGIHARCNQRVRADRGTTTLVCDPTRSLAYAEWEVTDVARTRADAPRHDANTLDDLFTSSVDSSVVHLAVHGEFNSDDPYRSGLLLADDGGEGGRFAAYSDGPSKYRIGTVAEIMTRMHLPRCRLAVMSACETAVARHHGSGEMVGLPSALLSVGARSVIATSWRVDDAASAILMHYFYAAWTGGTGTEPSPARALASARARLRAISCDDATRLLGKSVRRDGDQPFDRLELCDAFMCYGAF